MLIKFNLHQNKLFTLSNNVNIDSPKIMDVCSRDITSLPRLIK